jgi:hypothetical protein
MSSFKKLSKSDVSVVQYPANKQWNIASSSFSSYLKIYQGSNITGAFSTSETTTADNQYQRLIYSQINQLYYQTYISPLNTSSLANSIYYESASQQRPTASYFIYNDKKELIKNYPTGVNETVQVISVNQNVYGNKILPTTFIMSSSVYFIVDDGYGNLVDLRGDIDRYININYFDYEGYFVENVVTPENYIGNIFYAQGLAVITNQELSTAPETNGWQISFKNEHTIYEHEVRCLVKESDFNLSYNPSLITGSYTGSVLRDFATGSDFYTYATALGLYNDNNELLAVAKFGKPMLMSPDTDMTFVVKYDT